MSHNVAGLKFIIFLPQPPKFWDDSSALTQLAPVNIFKKKCNLGLVVQAYNPGLGRRWQEDNKSEASYISCVSRPCLKQAKLVRAGTLISSLLSCCGPTFSALSLWLPPLLPGGDIQPVPGHTLASFLFIVFIYPCMGHFFSPF